MLDVHHRPGNVHDSNGADTFIEHCVRTVRASLPRAKIEVRIDSAFFNQAIVDRLHSLGAKFTISVPFELLPMPGVTTYFERIGVETVVQHLWWIRVQGHVDQSTQGFSSTKDAGRGIFAELKTHCQMGYVPVKTRVETLYMFAGILAHARDAFDAAARRRNVPRCAKSKPFGETRRAHHSRYEQ